MNEVSYDFIVCSIDGLGAKFWTAKTININNINNKLKLQPHYNTNSCVLP